MVGVSLVDPVMGGPEVGGVAASQRRRRKEWQRHIKGSLHDGQGTLYN